MKVIITGTPKFVFDLGQDDLKMLMSLSAIHYDTHCRTVSEPGIGSFLWAWYICAHEVPNTVMASHRDLDTCLKILEGPPPDVRRAGSRSLLLFSHSDAERAGYV